MASYFNYYKIYTPCQGFYDLASASASASAFNLIFFSFPLIQNHDHVGFFFLSYKLPIPCHCRLSALYPLHMVIQMASSHQPGLNSNDCLRVTEYPNFLPFDFSILIVYDHFLIDVGWFLTLFWINCEFWSWSTMLQIVAFSTYKLPSGQVI